MAIAFLTIILCSASLAFMGALPVWAGLLLGIGGFTGLAVIGFTEQRLHRMLRRRGRQLQARWGLSIRHLGGLPLPLETSGSLYLLSSQLLLESEHDQLRIPLESIRKILLLSANQIRLISDKQLAEMLEAGNIRSFSILREKIRHHDSATFGHAILMITYDLKPEEARLLVLAATRRMAAIVGLFANPLLPSDRIRLLDPNGKTESPVV